MENMEPTIGQQLASRIKGANVQIIGGVEHVYFGDIPNVFSVACSSEAKDSETFFKLWDLMREAGHYVTVEDRIPVTESDEQLFVASTRVRNQEACWGASRTETLVRLFIRVMPDLKVSP